MWPSELPPIMIPVGPVPRNGATMGRDPRPAWSGRLLMARRADAPHDLLFGLLALQNGMVNQSQLVAAFGAWTLARDRPMADVLVGQGALSEPRRALLEALVAEHLAMHGGDLEKSLAAIPAGRSTRERLARLGDPEIDATLNHVGSGSADSGPTD